MYITKKSIFRKLSIISLAVLIFVSSLLGASVNSAHAVGVDTVVKLAGGKAVVKSLAEKAGYSLSKKQLDNVSSYIERKTYDGDEKFIDFATKSNQVIPSGDGIQSGFKKYVLDPALWVTGLDIIVDAIGIFALAYNSGEEVPIYAQCIDTNGFTYGSGNLLNANPNQPYWSYFTFMYNGYERRIVVTYSNSSGYLFEPSTNSDWAGKDLGNYTIWTDLSNQTFTQGTSSTVAIGSTKTSIVSTNFSLIGAYNTSSPCNVPVTSDDVVDDTNVSPIVINNFNNDTYNTNTTYNIEIEMPDIINYDDPTPWNEVDPNIAKEVEPGPPPLDSDGDGIPDSEDDSDGDGITDDKDSEADKGGWLENILPIITLIAIFDLLKAVIFYLARMFEFILTIPLIEAIPIDNIAFDWFRNAEIVGIEIYSVISLLATIGLSFAVYKVVRRLLP